MTSPSAAHTGHRHGGWPPAIDLLVDVAERLVDAGHASWCPTCQGAGHTARPVLGGRPGTFVTKRTPCTRCHGGRLNPYHGCTFTTDPPCTCTQRCQVYQPQETPTP